MSNAFLSAVWNDYPGEGGSELLVLVALADRANESGVCWPSIARIAEQVRLSRSQTQRVVHGLIGAGILSVLGNERGGAPGASRHYRINLASLTGRMGATGSTCATGRMGARDGSHGCADTGSTDATQTQREPKENPKKNICADGAPVDGENLPEWLDQDLWATYVRHYHDLQAMRGMSVPTAWEAKALRILCGLLADGHDHEQVIEQAINSRDGLLLPVSRHQRKGATSMHKTKFPTMRAAGWRFVGQPVNRPRPTVSIFH